MGVKPKCDVGIVKEWVGTSGEFIGACKGPGVGKPSEDPAVLTKFLVSGMYCMLLAYIVFFIQGFVPGGAGVGVSGLVSGVLSAFVSTWIVWFSFVKREPSCCFFCVCIEDFKFMHLIYGILLILSGLSQTYTYLMALLTMLSVMGPSTIVYIVGVVFIVLYSLCQIGAGVCLVKIGGKKAGVEIPEVPDKVGAPELATNA